MNYTLKITLLAIILLSNACNSHKKEGEKTGQEDGPTIEVNTPEGVVIEVGKGPDAMFLTLDKQKLYIANVEDTKISIINTQTDQVIKTIGGVRNPWGFSRLGNTNEVAVSAYDKQIVVIDFTTDKIVREKNFESPFGGIVTSMDGNYIFVIAIDAKQVWKLDAKSLQLIGTFPTGNAPDGIGLSANGLNLYVTNTEDGTISVINTEKKKVQNLKVDGKPELIHHNHDRSVLYISNFLKNKIHIIDANNGEITKELTGLDGPEEAVPNEDESLLYVVNFNLQKVFVYDTKNYSKLPLTYGTGKNPIGVIPLGEKMYVTNYGDNSVSVIPIKK